MKYASCNFERSVWVQVAGRSRWHRLRRDWLCATVCISSDTAAVAVAPDTVRPVHTWSGRLHFLPGLVHGSQASVGSVHVDVEVDHASRCRRSVWTLLQDDRMLAHDDGEGRPLRYMSLYGGIVAKLL
jgi:hypothetical protein